MCSLRCAFPCPLAAGPVQSPMRQLLRSLSVGVNFSSLLIAIATFGILYWLGIATTVFTLLGLELLTVLFKKTGIHSCLIKFSTGTHDNITKIIDMIRQQGGRVTSYEAEERTLGSQKRYYVSIILRYPSPKEEFDIYQYLQTLPDLFVEKIE